MSPLDTMTDKQLAGLVGYLNKIGGKRWLAYIVTTLIYIFWVAKDQFTFATYIMFVMAWSKLETDRKGGA